MSEDFKSTMIKSENASPLRKIAVLSLMQELSPHAGGGIVTGSFDPVNPDNLQRAIEADLPADFDRNELEGQVIEVTDWLARWSDNIAKEGDEPKPGVRITLWTVDGYRFSFAGLIAVKCWERIVSLIGPGPYSPPLRVTVQSFKMPSGRHTYGVVPVSGQKVTPRETAKPERGPEATQNSGATEATG